MAELAPHVINQPEWGDTRKWTSQLRPSELTPWREKRTAYRALGRTREEAGDLALADVIAER